MIVCKDNVLYMPRLGFHGRPSHYHHFLFGYLLPVINDLDVARKENIYLPTAGPMDKITESVGFKVYYFHKHYKHQPLVIHEIRKTQGFDGKNHPLVPGIADSINKKTDQLFSIPDNDQKHILLVDRGKPELASDNLLNKAKSNNPQDRWHVFGNTQGAVRRTIVNVEEVEDCLKPYGKVVRAVLDGMEIKEQITLFRNAWLVVAQHGAGLSNVIWSKYCKHVIEFDTLGGVTMPTLAAIPANTYTPSGDPKGPWFNSLYKEMKITPHYLPLKHDLSSAIEATPQHLIHDHNYVDTVKFKECLDKLFNNQTSARG